MSWSSEPGDELAGTPLSADDFVSALDAEESNKTRLERAATETINDLAPLRPPPEMFQPAPEQRSARSQRSARTTEPPRDAASPTGRLASPGRPSAPPARKKSYRWMPILVAVIVGGFVGLGGAMATDRIMNRPSQDEAASSDTARADQSSQIGSDSGVGTPLAPAAEVGATDVWSINSIRFVPGTTDLTNNSVASVNFLAQELLAAPNTAIQATVRTSSEATDAENQALSEAQAASLFDRFIAAGVEAAQVQISPLGRELITIRQPVPNFVELSAGLERSPLRSSIEAIPTYAIGINPTSGDLRPESIEPLDQLANALLADAEQRSVTLAAYAFTGADTAANDRLGAQAAAVIEDYLISTYGLDGQRIDLIIAGDAPYSVPAEVGSHVSFRRVS